MSFEDNPADEQYEKDMMADEIKKLEADNARLRRQVAVLLPVVEKAEIGNFAALPNFASDVLAAYRKLEASEQ